MTGNRLLARLLTVRRIRERQALLALAAAVRAGEANRALAERVEGLLAADCLPGLRSAHAQASVAAGREQLCTVRALLAERRIEREAQRLGRVAVLREAAGATGAVEARLGQSVDEEPAA